MSFGLLLFIVRWSVDPWCVDVCRLERHRQALLEKGAGASCGPLLQYRITELHVAYILACVLKALAYLHARGIVHRGPSVLTPPAVGLGTGGGFLVSGKGSKTWAI